MVVTATEFKANLGKYISLAETEDIIITKNGRSVVRLTNAKDVKLLALHSIRGAIKNKDVKLEEIRSERLRKYETVD